jgi:oxaloacetate decarboxylase beta subunit
MKITATRKEILIRIETRPKSQSERENPVSDHRRSPGGSNSSRIGALGCMLMLGNLLKESGVTERLAKTAGTAILDTCTILLSFTVGASTQATRIVDGVNVGFLTPRALIIFFLGFFSFVIAT